MHDQTLLMFKVEEILNNLLAIIIIISKLIHFSQKIPKIQGSEEYNLDFND